MLVIPAIDVRDGRCVRLRQGDFAQQTVYSGEPSDVAGGFIDAGADRVHVVDLDSARGTPRQSSTDAVRRVVESVAARGCAVQVGGGVRSVDAAHGWLELGADRVVIGSLAARAPELALAICRAVEGRVLLSLDVRAGTARVQGWTQDGATMLELLRRWHSWPAAGLVYTDTTRDGMLLGPNLGGLDTCVELYGRTIFLSGGVRSIEDITACQVRGAAGVVVGSAIYEGRIDLSAALRAFPVLAP